MGKRKINQKRRGVKMGIRKYSKTFKNIQKRANFRVETFENIRKYSKIFKNIRKYSNLLQVLAHLIDLAPLAPKAQAAGAFYQIKIPMV